MTRTRRGIAVCLACVIAGAGWAQTDGKPLSAIDWLSQSAAPEKPLAEPPVANEVMTPDVRVTPLDDVSKAATGILPASVSGLPRDLWSGSDAATLAALVRAQQTDTLPAMQSLLRVLLLAEADPAGGAADAFFLARLDRLVDTGALDAALALVTAAGPDTPALFARWFDISLLTGTEDEACDVMQRLPALAPDPTARIFCLARSGQWPTAALVLNTHRVLGDIPQQREALILRFLDPDLFEDEAALQPPDPVTPLTFRMHAAIGEPLNTASLPLPYAHADLRETAAWKAQLQAMERLAATGAVAGNLMLDIYTAHTPAASGGVWDRAAALQRFDAAITARDATAVAASLPAAWDAMRLIRAETVFAGLYASALRDLPLTGPADDIAFRLGLLSPDYETAATAGPVRAAFLQSLARGRPTGAPEGDMIALAVQSAFDGASPPQVLLDLVDDGQLGAAILRAIALFNAGSAGDAGAVTDALALLRHVGLEDVARRAALQLLLLERDR